MKANPICVPLVPMLLVLAGLLACNLSPAAPPVPGPTPVDLASLPSVESMGRLSLTQGSVQTGGRLLWTEDAGGSWLDITP
ncbi:MAG TPA: hypothetical protein VI410_00270, partial [Anaerolineales bacterium]|nr:hypothetical protein [Anaerolineales bacterium]